MHLSPSRRADAASISADAVPVCAHRRRGLVAAPSRLPATHTQNGAMFSPGPGDASEAVLATAHAAAAPGVEGEDGGSLDRFVRLLLRWCSVMRRSTRVFMSATFLADVFSLWRVQPGTPASVAACALVELMAHVIGPTPPAVDTDASGGTPASRLGWGLAAVDFMLRSNAGVFLGVLPTADMWLPRCTWPVVILRALCETVVTPDIAQTVRCIHRRRSVPPRMQAVLRQRLQADTRLEGDLRRVSGSRALGHSVCAAKLVS